MTQSIDDTIKQIQQAYKAKDFDKTISLCEVLLKDDTLTSEQRYQALFHIAHSLKEQKQYARAKEFFQTLDKQYSNKFEGLQGLFQTAQHQKDWSSIIDIGKQCKNRFSNMLQGYWWLGEAYKHLSEYDKASEQFKLLQDKFPNQPQGLQGLVSISQHNQDYQQTIIYSQAFIDKFSESWMGYFWLGDAYKHLSEYDKASEQFKLLQEKFPNQPQGLQGLVSISHHQKDYQQTIIHSQGFIKQFSDKWTGYWWLGDAYKHLGEYNKASEQFKLLQEKFPTQHQGWEGLINIAQHQQDWQQVITQTQKFIKRFPEKWMGYWWLGDAYKNLGEYDRAAEQFKLLQDKFPTMNQGWEGVVNIAQHQQDWRQKITCSQAFIDKFPEKWMGYWWLGEAYKNLAEYDKAAEQFKLLQDNFPTDTKGWEGFIRLAQHQQDWQQVITHTQEFIKQFPEKWMGYWWLGEAYKNLAEYDKAAEQFKLLQDNFPTDTKGWEGFIRLAQHKQDWEQVITHTQEFISQFPEKWMGYWWLGHAYKSLEEYDRAEKQFKLMQEKFPDQPQGLQGLISTSQHQENWQQAIKYTKELQNTFPELEPEFSIEYYQALTSYGITLEPKKPLFPFEEHLVTKTLINHCQTNHDIIQKKQQKTGNRTVVFSANFGDRDKLAKWTLLNGVDYYCFTDKFGLNSHGVTLLPPDYFEKDSKRNSLYYKTNGIHYFTDYDLIIWCDQNVNILDLISIKHITNSAVITSFTHWGRCCLYDEARVIVNRRIDKADIVQKQMDKYRKMGFPENYGLFETNVMAYKQSDKVKQLMHVWWSEIVKGSKRDQLSFTYSLWSLNLACQPLETDMVTARNGSSYEYQKH